jgi:hypothetical protein
MPMLKQKKFLRRCHAPAGGRNTLVGPNARGSARGCDQRIPISARIRSIRRYRCTPRSTLRRVFIAECSTLSNLADPIWEPVGIRSGRFVEAAEAEMALAVSHGGHGSILESIDLPRARGNEFGGEFLRVRPWDFRASGDRRREEPIGDDAESGSCPASAPGTSAKRVRQWPRNKKPVRTQFT